MGISYLEFHCHTFRTGKQINTKRKRTTRNVLRKQSRSSNGGIEVKWIETEAVGEDEPRDRGIWRWLRRNEVRNILYVVSVCLGWSPSCYLPGGLNSCHTQENTNTHTCFVLFSNCCTPLLSPVPYFNSEYMNIFSLLSTFHPSSTPPAFFNEIGGESRNDGKEKWRKEKRGMGDSPFKCPYAPVCIVQITFPLLG